jgi:hypothetical protein
MNSGGQTSWAADTTATTSIVTAAAAVGKMPKRSAVQSRTGANREGEPYQWPTMIRPKMPNSRLKAMASSAARASWRLSQRPDSNRLIGLGSKDATRGRNRSIPTVSRLHRAHHMAVKGMPSDSLSRIAPAVALTSGAARLAAVRMNRVRRSDSGRLGLRREIRR